MRPSSHALPNTPELGQAQRFRSINRENLYGKLAPVQTARSCISMLACDRGEPEIKERLDAQIDTNFWRQLAVGNSGSLSQ